MNKTTHILGGITFALGAGIKLGLPNYSIPALGCLVAAASCGALIPDIDKKKTAISSKHPFVSFFVRLFTTHRGFTHSLLALFLFAGVLYFPFVRVNIPLLTWAYYGAITGYLSHIILDMLNPDGVPLLFPLSTHISIYKIKTGGIIETFIRACLFLLSIYLAWICVKETSFWQVVISYILS